MTKETAYVPTKKQLKVALLAHHSDAKDIFANAGVKTQINRYKRFVQSAGNDVAEKLDTAVKSWWQTPPHGTDKLTADSWRSPGPILGDGISPIEFGCAIGLERDLVELIVENINSKVTFNSFSRSSTHMKVFEKEHGGVYLMYRIDPPLNDNDKFGVLVRCPLIFFRSSEYNPLAKDSSDYRRARCHLYIPGLFEETKSIHTYGGYFTQSGDSKKNNFTWLMQQTDLLLAHSDVLLIQSSPFIKHPDLESTTAGEYIYSVGKIMTQPQSEEHRFKKSLISSVAIIKISPDLSIDEYSFAEKHTTFFHLSSPKNKWASEFPKEDELALRILATPHPL